MQHGTGHGVGAYLNVHEGPHSFTSSTPLEVGHVITNEPGYCESRPSTILTQHTDTRSLTDKENQFGVRIESALFVKRIVVRPFAAHYEPRRLTGPFAQTKKANTGENWLCFERLTCVPIQTKMVKDNMITKEERDWIKVRVPHSKIDSHRGSR